MLSRNRRGRAKGPDTSLGGMVDLRNRVEALWEGRHDLSVDDVEANETIREAIDLLDAAGAPILKRLVPTLLAGAVVVVIILVLL